MKIIHDLKLGWIFCVLTLTIYTGAFAQSYSSLSDTIPGYYDAEVADVIHRLFAGLASGDSGAVAKCLSPDIMMQTVLMRGEETTIFQGKRQAFLEAIASSPYKLEERISTLGITRNGSSAMAWMEYEFMVNGERQHCGVNVFAFAHLDGEWKAMVIMDTRSTDCD